MAPSLGLVLEIRSSVNHLFHVSGVIGRSGYWLAYWRPYHLNQEKDFTSHMASAVGGAVVEVGISLPVIRGAINAVLSLCLRIGFFSGTWPPISGPSSLLWMCTTPSLVASGRCAALTTSHGSSVFSLWLGLRPPSGPVLLTSSEFPSPHSMCVMCVF